MPISYAFYKRHGQGTFVCTCARAHRASVSQERLDRLCSNLVSGLWAMNYVLSTSHGWYICTCARAHRASASREWLGRLCSNLVFGLGVINKVLSTSHGWGASARAHVRTPFPCLGNCWVHCAEIWWVIRVPVAMCFMQVFGWAPLHVRTCTPYLRISRTDWPIVLKFDVWLDTQMLRGLQKLEVGWLHIRTYVSSFVVTETAEPCPWSRTKNRFISFALARSSPNKASYWLILTVNLWSSANKFAAKLKTQHFHKSP